MKIMAPAGDQERLLAALKAGADEIYMGLVGFGARRFAGNFSVEEYCRAIDLAHRFDATIHLTLNTVMSDSELSSLGNDIDQLYQTGLDAVIVQDFGVARWLQRNFPLLPLHASTQMSLIDSAELNFLQEFGFKRAVLARELSLDEIKQVKANTSLEVEVFVSGALCLSCSGKCFLSSFIGGRSGNRGMCAQPCRQRYQIAPLDQDGRPNISPISSSVDDRASGQFYLSLRDQWQEELSIKQLLQIGVDSIKIEGRMKSPSYVYEAVQYYRQLIDRLSGIASPFSLKIKGESFQNASSRECRIKSLFNRGYAQGYLFEKDPNIINRNFSSNFGVEIGRVTPGGTIRLSAPLRNGDGIVYLDSEHQKMEGEHVSWINLVSPMGRNSRMTKVDEAVSGQEIQLETAPPKDAVFLFKTNDYLLNREITNRITQVQRYSPIDVQLTAKVGQSLSLTFIHHRATVSVQSDQSLSPAQKRATSPEELAESLDRFGETPFYLHACQLDVDPNVFVPKSLLNQLRQQGADQLAEQIVASYRRSSRGDLASPSLLPQITPTHQSKHFTDVELSNPSFVAVVRTKAQEDACRQFGLTKVRYAVQAVSFGGVPLKKRERKNDSGDESPCLAGSLLEAIRYQEANIPFDADWTFNIGNTETICHLQQMFSQLTTVYLSPELSESTCRKLIAFKSQWNLPIQMGLLVYGHLPAMQTRKTLFQEDFVPLVSQEGRSIHVVRNATWFLEGQGMTGSTVYWSEPLDLLDNLYRIQPLGFEELRLDFTKETAAEVLAILKRVNATSLQRHSHSYGFERGIF